MHIPTELKSWLTDSLAKPLTPQMTLDQEVVMQLMPFPAEIVVLSIELLKKDVHSAQAAEALTLFPELAIDALITELGNNCCQTFSSDGRCRQSCRILSDPLKRLLKQAQESNDPVIVEMVCRRTQDLYRVFQDKCSHGRVHGDELLVMLELPALHYLKQVSSHAPWDDVEAVASDGPEHLPMLFLKFNSRTSPLFRWFVALAAKNHGEQSLPSLRESLASPGAFVTQTAALALLEIGTPQSVRTIIDFMQKNPTLHQWVDAAAAFGETQNRNRVDQLLAEVIGEQADPQRIAATAEAVIRLGAVAEKSKSALRALRSPSMEATVHRYDESLTLADLLGLVFG